MIRAVRRQLELIRYYSAARERTAWTRAMDIAIVVALILAWPSAWVANHTVERRELVHVIDADLIRAPTGELVAVPLVDDPIRAGANGPIPRIIIEIWRTSRGWPFTSSEAWPEPHVKLAASATQKPQATELLRGTEEWDAARGALAKAGQDEAAAAWTRGREVTQQHLVAWIVNGFALWLVLIVAAWIGLTMLRAAVLFIERRRWMQGFRWRRAGCCEECGYDLRGLEFNERCPECGALAE